MKTLEKMTTGQGDDYKIGCLLDYPYFRDNYKIVAIDIFKQKMLHSDSRVIQQINFTANLDRAGNPTIYFIHEEEKKTKLDFSQGTVKVL